jgi:hypothetical protein
VDSGSKPMKSRGGRFFPVKRSMMLVAVTVALTLGEGATVAVVAQTGKESAIAALEQRMAALGTKADEARLARERWDKDCNGVPLGEQTHWAVKAYCYGNLNAAAQLDEEVRSELEAEKEAARHQGIYPGTLRAMKKRYRLDAY